MMRAALLVRWTILALLLPLLAVSRCEPAAAAPLPALSPPRGVSPAVRAALEAFYTATGGAAWKNHTGWLVADDPCTWYGVQCLSSTSVATLSLPDNGLTGTLPAAMASLTDLQYLDLSLNQIGGAIPAELGAITNLKAVTLRGNQLTGSIPAGLLQHASLENLDLGDNRLSGSIPAFGGVTTLRNLWLDNNLLEGSIPASIGTLTGIYQVDLSENQLSGAVPAAIGQLTKLQFLYLNDNGFTGSLPAELGNLTAARYLWLGANDFSGSIPPELGNLTALQTLDVYSNTLTGSLPPELGSLSELVYLSLSDNQLTGEIPSELGNLSKLQYLELNHNRLSGSLPPELGNLASLKTLELQNNHQDASSGLSGAVPAALGSLTELGLLDLRNNQLSGQLPSSLASLLDLQKLRFGRNTGLTGPLPQGLTALTILSGLTYDATALCMPDDDTFRTWLAGVKARGEVVTNWKVCGIEPHLGFSTPNALEDDVVLLHGYLLDDESGRVRGSTQVTATLTGTEGSLQLFDDGLEGDLYASDGHYSRWVAATGAEAIEADLYYKGWPVVSATLSLVTDPQLILLTDLRRLSGEFVKEGAQAAEDLDGDNVADFYELLERQRAYAERYRGIVYDLGRTITSARGFEAGYDALDPRPNRDEVHMGQLIRDLTNKLYDATGESIGYLVVVGSRAVVPSFVVDVHGEGNTRDMRRTELPYVIRGYTTPQEDTSPAPDIPYGRISARRPSQLAELFDVYERPLVTDPQANAFTLYHEADPAFEVWEEDWEPWVTARFSAADVASAPPYLAGSYYYVDGRVLEWRDVDVLQGLAGAAWTVLCSHGLQDANMTQLSHRLDKTEPHLPFEVRKAARLTADEYPPLAKQPGHLFINAGCWAALPSIAGMGEFVSQEVQARQFTYIGNTAPGFENDDVLWVSFADNLVLAGTPTVGAAWVAAYGPYWAHYSPDDPHSAEYAYIKELHGLPTQPLQHAASAQAAVAPVPGAQPAPAGQAGSLAASVAVHELTLPVDVAQFAVETGQAGTVVRPANGGALLEEQGQPVMPLVSARVLLPADASAITVTEITGERTTDDAGQLELAVADIPVRCETTEAPGVEGAAEAESGAASHDLGRRSASVAPATWSCRLPCRAPVRPRPDARSAPTGAYPAASFRANVVPVDGGWALSLAAIPASYAADGRLTLFHHMAFRITYAAASTPAAAITGVTVNGDQPLSAGQTGVPLVVGLTAGQALSLTVGYVVSDPGGFTIADGEAVAQVPAGASQATLHFDTAGWRPGPKLLNVTASGAGGIHDTWLVSITPQGLGLDLAASQRGLPGHAWPLAATVRDETGAAATGLAARFAVTLDGASFAAQFAEASPGVYTASVPASALAEGIHRAVVTVSDPAGRSASDVASVAVGVYAQADLPLVIRP